MDKFTCWFLIIVGGFIGTVFTFGMHYWNAPVTREEARQITADYQSHELRYGRNTKGRKTSLNEIVLHFSDFNGQLSIDSACVDSDLLTDLAHLPQGTAVNLLVHPNSDSVLSLCTVDAELLNFDEAVAGLSGEKTVFLFLGLFMYLGAAMGAYFLLAGKTY